MKKRVIYPLAAFLFTSLSFSSCNNTGQVSKQSDADIKGEVQQTMTKLLQYSSSAHLDSLLTYFDNSPDFKAMDEGKLYNYNEFVQLAKETLNSIKKQRFNKKWEDIVVLNDSLVHYLYYASDDITAKNDSTIHINDYAGSFLLKKIKGQWKVVFMHESVPDTK